MALRTAGRKKASETPCLINRGFVHVCSTWIAIVGGQRRVLEAVVRAAGALPRFQHTRRFTLTYQILPTNTNNYPRI